MAEYFYNKFLFHIATLCSDCCDVDVNSCLCCVCVAAAACRSSYSYSGLIADIAL